MTMCPSVEMIVLKRVIKKELASFPVFLQIQ